MRLGGNSGENRSRSQSQSHGTISDLPAPVHALARVLLMFQQPHTIAQCPEGQGIPNLLAFLKHTRGDTRTETLPMNHSNMQSLRTKSALL